MPGRRATHRIGRVKALAVIGLAALGCFVGLQVAVGFVTGSNPEQYLFLGGLVGALVFGGAGARVVYADPRG